MLNPIWKVSSPHFRPRVRERRYLNEHREVILPSECDDGAPAKSITAKGLKTGSSPSPGWVTKGQSLYISDLHSQLWRERLGRSDRGHLGPLEAPRGEGRVCSHSVFVLLPFVQGKPFQGLAPWLGKKAQGIQPRSRKGENASQTPTCPLLRPAEEEQTWASLTPGTFAEYLLGML